MIAASNDSKDMIQFLIDHKADVNASDEDGSTALSAACDRNSADVVNILLENGANIRSIDNVGDTCLHHLLSLNTIDNVSNVFEIILKQGCDATMKNAANEMAFPHGLSNIPDQQRRIVLLNCAWYGYNLKNIYSIEQFELIDSTNFECRYDLSVIRCSLQGHEFADRIPFLEEKILEKKERGCSVN